MRRELFNEIAGFRGGAWQGQRTMCLFPWGESEWENVAEVELSDSYALCLSSQGQ